MDPRVLSGFLGPVGLIVVIVALVRWRRALPLDREAARERRTAALVTLGGYVLAMVVLNLTHGLDRVEPGVPALATAVAVGVCGVAERRRAPSRGDRRAASLTIRRGTESVRLMTPYLVGLAASVAAIGFGYVTSGADGVSGSRSWGDTVVTVAPYPGRAYTWATLGALGLLALVTGWALRRVDARPARVDDPALDRALRLGARIRVLRWSAIGSLLTAGGLCLTIGPKMDGLTQRLRGDSYLNGGSHAPVAPWDWMQNLGFAATIVGIGVMILAFFVVLEPAPRVPQSRSAAARVCVQ